MMCDAACVSASCSATLQYFCPAASVSESDGNQLLKLTHRAYNTGTSGNDMTGTGGNWLV